jgi:hypothetical protein
VALASCTDFATPAELETTQILAIQSVPASLTPGASATLEIFAADQNGPLADPDVTWSVQPQVGLPALGTLIDDGSTVQYTAPESVPELPTLVTVEARLTAADASLVAVKAMLIGGPTLTNPDILGIAVNGLRATESVTLAAGEEITVAVELAEAPSDDVTYAWYARPGTIDEYRSSPTPLVAPEETGEGWLIVVVRDGGGTSYFSVPTRVQ